MYAHIAWRPCVRYAAIRRCKMRSIAGDASGNPPGDAHSKACQRQQRSETRAGACLDCVVELAYGDELEDAVLDVLHAVMVRVEALPGKRDVKLLVIVDAIRHRRQPVKVVSGHVVL